MKRMMLFVLMVVLAGAIVHTAYAGEDEDSIALAKKGALIIKEQGREKGFAEIMNTNGSLRKGRVMLTVNDFTGVCLANAAFPKLVGQNHYSLRDPDEKYFIQEGIQIAKTKGSGWLQWSFTNPETKKISRFKAWVQRVEGMDLFVMAPIPLQNK